MSHPANVEEFECIVCNKKSIRATKARPGRKTRSKVCRCGAITCSRKCAMLYRNNFGSMRMTRYKESQLQKGNKPLNINDNILTV